MSKTNSNEALQPCQEETAIPTVTGTGEILSDTTSTGRKADWKKYKLQNRNLVEMYRQINNMRFLGVPDVRDNSDDPSPLVSGKFLGRLQDCSTFLLFARNEAQDLKLKSGNFCHARFCPTCNWRRSLKQFHDTSAQVSWIRQQHGDVKFLFLTLTVKNCPNGTPYLRDTMKLLSDSFLKLINPMRLRDKNNKLLHKFRRSLLGTSRAMEITFHPEQKDLEPFVKGAFHPHLHVILAMQPNYYLKQYYLTQKDFQTLWKQVLGVSYDPIVDIRELKDAKGIAEASKYSVKLSDVISQSALTGDNPEIDDTNLLALEHLHEATQKKQLLTLSGCFKAARAALKQQEHENDLIHVGDDTVTFDPVEYVLFCWKAHDMNYIC